MTLTPEQQATVEAYQAYNVPAKWFTSEPEPNGTVEVIAIGEGFTWSFVIAPDGDYSSAEALIHADGWSTGIEI